LLLTLALDNDDYANAASDRASGSGPRATGGAAMQIKVFEGHRVELVEEAANHWLEAHPTIEVLKIDPTFPVLVFPPDVGAMHPYEHKFVLTIWYREQPEQPEQPKRTPPRPLPLS
jgi:hypothetical protein